MLPYQSKNPYSKYVYAGYTPPHAFKKAPKSVQINHLGQISILKIIRNKLKIIWISEKYS